VVAVTARARRRPAARVAAAIAAATGALAAGAATATAAGEPASGPVDGFTGAYSDSVPIEAPGYYALAPALAFTYGSQNAAGAAGVGWTLAGASTIERTTNGRGAPVYTAEDIFVLDGDPLIPCPAGSSSPGCLAGGTHATTLESRRKIVRDAAADTFTIWTADGRRATYQPLHVTAGGTFRWAVREVRDPRGHVATYDWSCDGADACYLDAVRYASSEVRIYRELRPDPTSAATGRSIATTRYRVRSVVVRETGAVVRAYVPTYQLGTGGRTILAAIEVRGTDAGVDAAGAVSGGTVGLRRDFTYTIDPLAQTLSLAPAVTPTGPGTTEALTWFKRVCATSSAAGELVKTADPGCDHGEWDGGGSSTRALTGPGAATFRFVQWQGATAAGLATDDADTTPGDIDHAIERGTDGIVRVVERGVPRLELGADCCSTYRIAIESGAVRYYRNGVLQYTSAVAPSYPLRLDVAVADNGWGGVTAATLTGPIADVALWCPDGHRLHGDFDGDGRGDLACDATPWSSATTIAVRLGRDDGFAAAAPWLAATGSERGVGDFDGDGKDDVYLTDLWSGEIYVARSTGDGFAAPVAWGGNGVCRIVADFRWYAGDFNADGRADLACQRTRYNTAQDGVWVGLSTGTGFQHSRWIDACDAAKDTIGVGDFDGDGRDDWWCQHDDAQVAVHLARPGQFVPAALTGFYLGAGACPARRWTPADFNGDGKLDLACAPTGELRLATGRGFVTAPAITAFCTGHLDQLVSADLGGDGMVDWICNAAGAGASDLTVRRGTATGLGAPAVVQAGWCPGSVSPIDFDGDRKTDLLCDEALQPIGRAGTPGLAADLLAAATTGAGGARRVTYTPSTRFANANNPPPQYVVTALTTDDGRAGAGAAATERFDYAGGLVDRRTGRFLGFRYARRERACAAPPCAFTETWYHQSYGSRTQPERIDVREADATLLRSTIYELATDGGVAPHWTRVTGAWRHDYPAVCGFGDPCTARRSFIGTEYDAWGNVAITRDHGDVDRTGDERRVDRLYRPNPATFVIGAVAAETEYPTLTGGPIVRQTLNLYDGAASWDAAPTRGELTRAQDWLDTATGYLERSWVRDANGNVVAATDRVGATTTATYTPSGRWRTSTTDALGHVESFAWSYTCDAPITITDANGAVSSFRYDALCRVARIDRPGGDFEVRRYPAVVDAGTQYVETAGPGATTGEQWRRVYFDGLGRAYRTTLRGPTPAQTLIADERSYGPDGAVVATARPRYDGEPVHWTRTTYDALGRWTHATGPAGAATRSYGADTVAAFDPAGHLMVSTLDVAGRAVVTTEITSDGVAATGFQYGPHGMTRMTDPVGNAWSWTYDSLGRRRTETDPDRGTLRYVHDGEGRVIETVDALGQRAVTVRDLLGRGVSHTTRLGTPAPVTTTYTYDEPRPGAANIGRLTTTRSPAVQIATDYDVAGREIRQTHLQADTAYAFSIGYDAAGRLRWMTYPDGDTLGTPSEPIEYDAAGRTRRLPLVASEITWHADGTLAGYLAGNGIATSYGYDAAGRMSRVVAAVPVAAPVLDLELRRDPDGLIEEITSPDPEDGWLYAYDDLHRLTDATNPGAPAMSESFAYDLTDNLTWTSRLGSIPYPAPGAPRPHGALVLDGAGVAYDASGDMTAGGGHAITWRGDHKPGAVDGEHYDYDAMFNRARVESAAGATTIEIGDYYRVVDGVVTKYVPLADRVIYKRVGKARYWLHTDHQHSVRRVTNRTGEVVTIKRYRPYGEELATGRPEEKSYTGLSRDATGLIYMHARYYDPAHARFVSPDPAAASDPRVGLNRYGFGLGDPVNHRDPSGNLVSIMCFMEWGCFIYDWGSGSFDFGFTDETTVVADPPPATNPFDDVPRPGENLPPERDTEREPRGGGGGGAETPQTQTPAPTPTPPGPPGKPPKDDKDKKDKKDKKDRKPTAEEKLLEAMANAINRGISRGANRLMNTSWETLVSAENMWDLSRADIGQAGSLEDMLLDELFFRDLIAPTNEAAGIIRSDVERWICRPGSAWSCD
jgi:RHS repeat-associated protein